MNVATVSTKVSSTDFLGNAFAEKLWLLVKGREGFTPIQSLARLDAKKGRRSLVDRRSPSFQNRSWRFGLVVLAKSGKNIGQGLDQRVPRK